MATSVKAEYTDRVLTLQEPLDFEEGTVVIALWNQKAINQWLRDDDDERYFRLAVEERPAADTQCNSLLEIFDRIHQSAPPGAWDNLPTDLAKNKKHYLYGHPKEED